VESVGQCKAELRRAASLMGRRQLSDVRRSSVELVSTGELEDSNGEENATGSIRVFLEPFLISEVCSLFGDDLAPCS
jgi:hypothetical protein